MSEETQPSKKVRTRGRVSRGLVTILGLGVAVGGVVWGISRMNGGGGKEGAGARGSGGAAATSKANGGAAGAGNDSAAVVADFRHNVQPLLQKYCYDCHANGEKNGDV